jgi:hypothetical protein
MKYLFLIYSNAENWQHPIHLRHPDFLALPKEERDEINRRADELFEEVTTSGEFVVGTALADPVWRGPPPTAMVFRRSPTGRTWRPRSSWPATSCSTARPENVRRRSPHGFRTPGSAPWRSGRSWT